MLKLQKSKRKVTQGWFTCTGCLINVPKANDQKKLWRHRFACAVGRSFEEAADSFMCCCSGRAYTPRVNRSTLPYWEHVRWHHVRVSVPFRNFKKYPHFFKIFKQKKNMFTTILRKPPWRFGRDEVPPAWPGHFRCFDLYLQGEI